MVEVIVTARDASGSKVWVLYVVRAAQEIIRAEGGNRVVNVIHATGPHYSGDSTCRRADGG